MLRNKIFLVLFFSIYSLSFAQGDFTYQAKGKRNPFIPLVSKDGRLMKLEREEGGKQSDLLVDGLIYDKQGISYALVNGRVAGIGDYVGEYRVLKITEDKVAFLKDDQIREVMINKGGDN